MNSYDRIPIYNRSNHDANNIILLFREIIEFAIDTSRGTLVRSYNNSTIDTGRTGLVSYIEIRKWIVRCAV